MKIENKIANEKLANYINEKDAQKLAITKKEIVSLCKLLLQMEKGGGLCLYPLPTCSNLENPKEKCLFINSCLVCGLWFKCFNHIFASCGLMYHLWSLIEHIAISHKWLVLGCVALFFKEWCVTMGIQPKSSQIQFIEALTIPNESVYKNETRASKSKLQVMVSKNFFFSSLEFFCLHAHLELQCIVLLLCIVLFLCIIFISCSVSSSFSPFFLQKIPFGLGILRF